MKTANCSICLSPIDRENAPILAISGAGVPRCLCDACANDIEVAGYDREYDNITEAMDRISKNLSEHGIDDPLTLSTMTALMKRAAARAELIQDGEYDFSIDEVDDYELDEIPDELLESEEDKQLDAEEKEQSAKVDKVLNWIWGVVLAGVVAFMAWWFFFR